MKNLFTRKKESSIEPVEWMPPIEKYENVPVDAVKFIFSQAEKRLDSTVKVADLITSKSYSLFSLMAGLSIAITGFLVNQLKTTEKSCVYIFVSCITAIYLFLLLFFLLQNVFPKKYHPMGSIPSELFANEFFQGNQDENLKVVHLYVSELENYNKRINHNVNTNDRRQRRLKKCLYGIVFLPIIGAVAYFLS